MQEQKKEISWEAPEFKELVKGPYWYMFYAGITVLLIGYGAYTNSLITIIAFSVMSLVGLTFAFRKPEKITFTLTSTGIVVADKNFPYKIIKKFWIVYYPPEIKTLNLETSAYLNSHIKIELGDQNPIEVKKFLKNYLPEDLDKEESLPEVIARKLKF